ncbi:hypothetical protein COT47_02900, partial [Candidatus Woesearchaeota archaeon CG08_land_8_20_14_0_20_43_7]
IKPLSDSLVNVSAADVDLIVTYLSGGGAGNAAVKLRSLIKPMYVSFDDYEDFTFSNGEVKEGLTKSSGQSGYYGFENGYEDEENDQPKKKTPNIKSISLTLDKTGSLRTKITNIPKITSPHNIIAELEFKDPNGEIQTVAKKIPLYSSKLHVGITPDSWAASGELFKFKVIVLDLNGKPVSDT